MYAHTCMCVCVCVCVCMHACVRACVCYQCDFKVAPPLFLCVCSCCVRRWRRGEYEALNGEIQRHLFGEEEEVVRMKKRLEKAERGWQSVQKGERGRWRHSVCVVVFLSLSLSFSYPSSSLSFSSFPCCHISLPHFLFIFLFSFCLLFSSPSLPLLLLKVWRHYLMP